MIDCGSESIESVAEYNVMPYLVRNGLYKIDTAVITHWHSDHTSGLKTLIENKMIKHLAISDKIYGDGEMGVATEIMNIARTNNVSVNFVSKGDTLNFGDFLTLEVLSPQKYIKNDANNDSLVLMANVYDKKILFAADITEKAQYLLSKNDISTDILKVPHHGGKCETANKFSSAANPTYTVISCGKNNRYSHPASETLELYKNSKILRTDTMKTIEFTITDKNIENLTGEENAKN